jgi:predicted outer membrane repeat protein
MNLLERNQKMQTRKWGIKVAILCLCLGVASTCPAKVIHVDVDAAGANDGSSWADAYNYLQDALMFATAGDEIRVAQGVYRPDDFVLSDRPNLGREETFHLKNGVTLKGGYAGFGDPEPDARDVELYETILSGDLDGNDDGYVNRDENSYHVVIASETDPSAVLDGFTVMGGNADGLDEDQYGGGIYNESGSPTLIDCIFTSNSASLYDEPTWCGGGMANFNGSPTLTNCTFSDNWAGYGGGMYNYFSSITLVNCTFTRNGRDCMVGYYSDVTALDCIFSDNDGWGLCISGESKAIMSNCLFIGNTDTGMVAGDESTAMLTNCAFARNSAYGGGGMSNGGTATLINCVFRENWAADEGGGLYNALGSVSLVGCLFIQNQATGSAYGSRGGAIYCGAGSVTLIDCIFTGNEAHDYGGAIDTYESTLTMDNCTFAGNSANRSGGGLRAYSWSTTEMENCTFVGNSAPDGKALACDSFSQKYPSNLQLTNCILWDGEGEIWNNDSSTVIVTYSDVQEDWPGEGNIDADPCFANPDSGDYHLKSQAGRWDANEGRWTKDDVTSPCIDAGDPMSPIGLEPFPNGGRINMGAYGGTAEASKSYFGKPPCETIVPGDINGDCIVDFRDLCIMALHWCEDHNL